MAPAPRSAPRADWLPALRRHARAQPPNSGGERGSPATCRRTTLLRLRAPRRGGVTLVGPSSAAMQAASTVPLSRSLAPAKIALPRYGTSSAGIQAAARAEGTTGPRTRRLRLAAVARSPFCEDPRAARAPEPAMRAARSRLATARAAVVDCPRAFAPRRRQRCSTVSRGCWRCPVAALQSADGRSRLPRGPRRPRVPGGLAALRLDRYLLRPA